MGDGHRVVYFCLPMAGSYASGTVSHSIAHWEQNHRLVHRWYLAPAKLALMYPDSSPKCWRKCGQRATLLHTFWYCKTLSPLWNKVPQIIKLLYGTGVALTSAMALLLVDMNVFPARCRTVIIHLLLSTTICIAAYWKQIDSPPFREVIWS